MERHWQRLQVEEELPVRRRHYARPPGAFKEPGRKALAQHQGLCTHESLLLMWIRTGKVGLHAFLFEKGVPGVAILYCRYSSGAPEMATHLVLDCFFEVLARPRRAPGIEWWLQAIGRFLEFRLAERIKDETEAEETEGRGQSGFRGLRGLGCRLFLIVVKYSSLY